MATTRSADGTRLHYEVFGNRRGEPLLLIQGLGADSRGWMFQRVALGRHHRCIVFDNRGAGRSEAPPGRYDLMQMAADAAAVLDAAGVESAHVVGASMGGAIAQLLAVTRPERVRSLVLACTACRHHQWRRELLASWAWTASHDGTRALWGRTLRWLVGRRAWNRLYLPAQLLGSLLLSGPGHGFAGQVAAILGADDSHRDLLGTVAAPTLVVVGSQDILTPLGDSEELAELIPGAELVVVRGAAHALMIEQAGEFNRLVLDFLERVRADGGALQPAPEAPAGPGVAAPPGEAATA